MKRTTYIIFGIMLAGLLAMSGIIFYISRHTIETLMQVKGERQTVVLPPCKVVKFTQSPAVWREKEEGVVESVRVVSFREVPLTVAPADSLQGSFSFASDMASFMSVTAAGDTAFITFGFPAEKVGTRFQDARWLEIESEEMRLNIPENVQTVLVEVDGLKTDFRDFSRDTLSFMVRNVARVGNCRITSLTAHAQSLWLNSGEVQDLRMDLDGIAYWQVNADSFRIDTEHLSGSREHHNWLQKGECRRVLWTPKGKNASLNVTFNQAAAIEVN